MKKKPPPARKKGESPGFNGQAAAIRDKIAGSRGRADDSPARGGTAEAHGGIAELRASAETYFLPDARAKALHLEATIDTLSFSLGDGHVSAGASAGIAVLDHAMYARKQERRAASAPGKV